MTNEILLILSLLLIYGTELLFFKLFGKQGLYCFTVLATIAANIEVLIVVEAFGMEMTLGNVLFASTFLVTDIISEVYGEKDANKAVNIGIVTSIAFMIFSQYWLLYVPAAGDWAMDSMKLIFSGTARVVITSMLTYAVVQRLDVWLYHKWWDFTSKKFENRRGFLWLRNNASTLLSQFFNAILFNLGAFWGVYDNKTLWSIIISTYVIYIVTSLADTPFVYAARKMYEKESYKLPFEG